MKITKRIGILATGSELVMGEILNTNGQQIAQALLSLGVEVGEHVVVDDNIHNLQAGLKFLLSRHDGIITIGGLGPTSDDCTRQLVAEQVQRPLIFNDDSWERITQRLKARNLPIPDMNRQQALFPKGATIFPNANGTADGCAVSYQGQWIFLLPGPPRECIPMFHNDVLPLLDQYGFTSSKRLYRWRLMGVSESAMAEKLEAFGKPYHLQFGYRAHFPFLDIKLHLHDSPETDSIIEQVYDLVAPNLVTTENSNLSTQLQQALHHFSGHLSIRDAATKGALAAALITPHIHKKVTVVHHHIELPDDYCVEVSGLEDYWQLKPGVHQTELHVVLSHQGKSKSHHSLIFLRGQETLQYAIEFISWHILNTWLRK